LFLARWRSFFREPSAVFWSYGFPLIMTLALGIAFRSRAPDPVDVAVIGDGAATVVATLNKDPLMRARVMGRDEAMRALYAGKLTLVADCAANGACAYNFDPTRPDSRLGRYQVNDVLQSAAGSKPAFTSTDHLQTAPGARYIDFLVPGLLGFGLLSSGLWGVGYVLVEMRTRKLLKRLVATPMSRVSFLGSFIAMRGVFLAIELPVLLGFGHYAFGVPVRGSLALVLLVAVLGSLTFAAMGLLVASRANNVQTVGGLINLATLPMSICSGVFFSASRFPDVLQPLIRALPLTALNDALRAVMLEGAGFMQILSQMAIIVAWGLVCGLGAAWWFRWR
jgi:ABC-type multidrug transport system permease subunit